MYGLTHGELLGGPIKNLYDFVEQSGTAPDIDCSIASPSAGCRR